MRYGAPPAGRTVALALALCTTSSGWSASAVAQDTQADRHTDAARQAASEHFTAGVEAAREDDWARAREAFERAYERVPRPEILVNLARAQVETGRLVDAAASYERFLEQTAGANAGGAQRLRAKAEAALERVRERIPRLRIEGAHRGDVLRVDDEEHEVARDAPVQIAVDPGRHEVVLQRDGDVMARSDVHVVEGEEKGVVLAVPVPEEGGLSMASGATARAGAEGGRAAQGAELPRGAGGDGDDGEMLRFFAHLGLALGFGYVKSGMEADSVPESGTSPERRHGWVEPGTDNDPCMEPEDGPDPVERCNVRVDSPGWLFAPALRFTVGYWIIERFGVAATLRWQFQAGQGTLSSLLIGLRAQALLTEPAAEGFNASAHLGTGIGQIQLQPDQAGSDKPWISSGLHSVQIGGTVGYRFIKHAGLYLTQEAHILFPRFMFAMDVTLGVEVGF